MRQALSLNKIRWILTSQRHLVCLLTHFWMLSLNLKLKSQRLRRLMTIRCLSLVMKTLISHTLLVVKNARYPMLTVSISFVNYKRHLWYVADDMDTPEKTTSPISEPVAKKSRPPPPSALGSLLGKGSIKKTWESWFLTWASLRTLCPIVTCYLDW